MHASLRRTSAPLLLDGFVVTVAIIPLPRGQMTEPYPADRG